ncbi:MAG: hypothetical protein J7527_04805 [Chitinophagaceae bacterium]|nr:hypothetical protein [Chitinophagaceae bacterium]
MQFPDTNNINSRESFIEFIELLHADLNQNKEKWENSTLETFLETLAQYAKDIQGYYDYSTPGINADTPSWKVFADMLIGASVYE